MKRTLAVMLILLGGCASGPQYSAGPKSTDVDVATTQPNYWLEKEPAAVVTDADFEKLVAACEDVARAYFFKLDRVDYRVGLITTQPMVTSQWFEPWRQDARTLEDVEESSLASIRRTIRFELERQDGGAWQVAPKVLVERQSIAERRITSVVLYRSVFASLSRSRLRPSGSREADQGIYLPQRYWYPLRRDTEFERLIAQGVQERIRRP